MISSLLLREVFEGLRSAGSWVRISASRRSVILGWSQVHLILVCATWLDNTWWFSYDLLVRHVLTICTTQLRIVGQTQIEFGGVQLDHV